MIYQDSTGPIDTPRKILKVNHAGEFGAINIYRAQILVCRAVNRKLVPELQAFLKDELKHLDIFWTEIQQRNGIKCKSYWLCGIGGWFMGFFSALLGKKGVMACTWAVESVVAEHLKKQLIYLKQCNDLSAYKAVNSILQDEEHHRDTGSARGGKNALYGPFRLMIRLFTEGVIRFGMR